VGYDAGKQVKGRKIHALVDSEGLPMRVVVHSAATQDRDGAGLVLNKIRRRFPWLELIWADGGYNAWQDAAVAKVPALRMEIVKRSDDMKGSVVLPRRWVVERTFSWFGRNRRLAKDFEILPKPWAPSLPSPPSSLPSGGLPRRRSPTHQTANLHRTMVKVCKSDCEGTVAETRDNGEVAPKAVVLSPSLGTLK
jgi:transposase